MNKKPVAVVLGGTTPHISLLNNLKSRGYYTILIDYLENSPAKSFSDEHIQESTLDKEKVLNISKKVNASLVISTCIDQANVTACYVSEKLSLPHPYSYESALIVTDKSRMKDKMLSNGIPTAQYFIAGSIVDLRSHNFSYPLVVKPADSTGSKGVRRAGSVRELEHYFNEALKISQNGKVIIEEFKDGIELQVDCFIQNKSSKIIMIRKKNRMNLYGDFVMQSVGSTIPADVSESIKSKLLLISQKIAQTFELDNVPLFMQVIVDNDNNINVLEFAPRVGGGLSYKMIELYTGFDFLNAAINSFLRIDTMIRTRKNDGYLLSGIIYATGGIYGEILGFKNLIDEGIIDEYFYFLKNGDEIGNDMSTKSRVGAFLITSNSKLELENKMKLAITKLDVHDNKGASIMRKDIYANLFN